MNRKPLPKKTPSVGRRLHGMRGIDRRYGAPVGSLRDAVGAICTDGVTLRGAPTWRQVYAFPDTLYPQSVTAVGGGVFAMCRMLGLFGDSYIQDDKLQMVAYMEDGTVLYGSEVTDRESGEEMPLPSDINTHRSIVQFNVYSEDGQLSDAIGGRYDKKLLVFPDKMWVDLPVSADGFAMAKMEEERGDVPNLHFVTVSGGRLFGVDRGRIYASAYNDPWNWDVDTPDDIGAENAWVTTTGADTRGDGDFTAVCAYGGDVWAMKADFGHIVSGGSNPFTVKDTDALGAIGMGSVARGDGRLFYVRSDGVRMAEGNTVRVISDPLCIDRFTCGICAYRDGVLYVAEGGRLFAYHVKSDSWSALPLPEKGELVSLTVGEKGVYAMMSEHIWENYLYLLDGEPTRWEAQLYLGDFELDTDKGPATLTLHAVAESGARIWVTLTDENSGKSLSLGSKSGEGGSLRFRTRIRGGAGHSYLIGVEVEGQAVIRGISLTARDGVKGNG